METKRPRGRETHVTNNSSGVHKRGSGLGTGPVGSSGGYGKYGNSNGSSGGGHKKAGTRAAFGGGGSILVILLMLLLSGKGNSLLGILGTLLGSSAANSSYEETGSGSQSDPLSSALGGLSEILGGAVAPAIGGSSSSAGAATSYSRIDTSVAFGSRAKYTNIVGNGDDTVTIMVYMCGTDLESRNGMASSDLSEMAKASLSDKINLLVYTGGCKSWRTSGISNSNNQIYQVTGGSLKRLVSNDGSKVMTDPDTLSAYIKWCKKNYPADRYELIFWDHGGGSVSGYGYDEKNPRSGSMTLAGINKALKAGGVKFDFVGFDACLMATAETALMLDKYADYMIASEETEPGIGWYYTNWLNQLSKNTSLSTLEIGKSITDDFVAKCNERCPGQKTTLSVIDLAEFSNTVPSKLTAFSKSLTKMISSTSGGDAYKTVSDARYSTREFAQSNHIDQIDLTAFCKNFDSSEANALAKALQSSVKYNKTSSNMTNAYGVSIYFPYQKTSSVEKACDTYEAIGMDDSYSDCIRAFAGKEQSGQIPSSSGGSSLDSLLGALLSLPGKSMGASGFDGSALVWKKTSDNHYILDLPKSQWDLVHSIDQNMFYDDGEGYVDLGLDNNFDWTNDGGLIANTDRTWLAINGQVVAYYHVDTVENGDNYTITGRVPALLNGERVNLWLVFDNANPYGYIAGAARDYEKEGVEVVAKNLTELKAGDKLDFLCDYYNYNGDYEDSYFLGEQMTVSSTMEISNVDVGRGKVRLLYRFTDYYNQAYWSKYIEL